jgi:hypothetical protein
MNALLSHKADRSTAHTMLGSLSLTMDISGALFLPKERTLVVADMHLEKSTSGARRGVFLPPYDSKLTLELLARAVQKFDPTTLIFLGDSFHDAHAPHRLDDHCLEQLGKLGARCDLIWVTGNHDPLIPQSITTHTTSAIAIAGVTLTHIPNAQENESEISGHLHPVVTVTGRGRTLRRRCFASDGKRMIVPAFGAYTGGLNIKDKAFDGLFKRGQLVTHIIGDEAIYTLPVSAKNR